MDDLDIVAALAVTAELLCAGARAERFKFAQYFGTQLRRRAFERGDYLVGAIVIGITGWRWARSGGPAIDYWCYGRASGFCVIGAYCWKGRPKEMVSKKRARDPESDGVMEVHDVHIWSLGGGEIAMSCHARVPDMHLDKCESLLSGIKAMLAKEFSIGHVTVQLERAGLPAQSGYVMPEPAKR